MSKSKIVELVDQHTPNEGVTETGLEGLQLFRATQPVERIPAVYSPSVCGILQGSKRAYLGGEEHVYDESGFLCCTMPLPIEAAIPHATPEEPVLGFLLSLETQVLLETLVKLETISHTETSVVEQMPGLMVAEWDAMFSDAVLRMLQLLDDPEALQILGRGRLREVMFALVRGGAGTLLLRNLGASRDISRVLGYIQKNLHNPLTIEDLVKESRMSKTVLHRKFKAATTLSPLQFIKALRLNDAAMLIASGQGVTQAAFQVGYESSSQFSREFRRHYGSSPREWASTYNRVGV